jgi:hypothetical protein
MNALLTNIEQQIEFNQGKNIFLDKLDNFQFSKETLQTIKSLTASQISDKNSIINFVTDKSIKEFCRINQYYSFNSEARKELSGIYSKLLDNILTHKLTNDNLAKNHYNSLKNFLIKTNSFAQKVYTNKTENIVPVPCSEYNAELQMDVLHINLEQIIQPVLDIGCGSKGNLVHYLSSKGVEAYGIDRFSFSEHNLMTCDWLEFNYEPKKWGTIISHLGFSNHFNHHNIRIDGNYLEYAKAYKKILSSLKVNGQFHYAPDLPFIEKYIDSNEYLISRYGIVSLNKNAIVIKRLK